MTIVRKSLVLVMTLALLFGAWVVPEEAQAKTSLGLSPSLLELEANPGNSGNQTVTVTNSGDEPFSATVSVKDYPNATEEQSAKSWYTPTPERITLGPGEKQDITIQMKVPSDTASGGYYAMVGLLTDAKDEEGNGTATSGEVGVPILLNVQGSEALTREASVSEVVPRLTDEGKVGFQVITENTGENYFFPTGKLLLRAQDSKEVERLDIPQGTAVIPGTEKPVDASGSLSLDTEKDYVARATVDYGGEKPATGDVSFNPEPDLAIQEIGVEEQDGKPPNLWMSLANEGDIAAQLRGRLDVYNTSGLVGSASPGKAIDLTPGEEEEVDTEYPGRLGPGEYVLHANLVYGNGETLEEQAPFTITNDAAQAPQPDAPEAPEGTSSTSWLLIAGVPLAVIVVLVAAILWLPQLGPVRKRIRRALEAFSNSE